MKKSQVKIMIYSLLLKLEYAQLIYGKLYIYIFAHRMLIYL